MSYGDDGRSEIFMMTKFCKSCNQEKPIDCFRINSAKINKTDIDESTLPRRYNCGDCEKTYDKKLKALHKIAPAHSGLCDCCGKQTDKLVLDHCHISGEFRGWLCTPCNKGIGILGDTIEKVKKAYEYLRKANKNYG